MTKRDAWVTAPQMSDEAIRKGTGRDWRAWVDELDAWGARERNHTDIARHVAEDHGLDGWWAQAVTVGYERIRGLRKASERPDGYSMNASKTVPVPVGELFALFVDDDKRGAWLGDDVLRLRTASAPKSARFDLIGGGGILAAVFVDKGDRSAVQLQLNGIDSEGALAAHKATWKARLDRLARHIVAITS
jgi:hypothetical protein